MPPYSNHKCVHWPGITVAERMGSSGCVRPYWDTEAGLTVGVKAADFGKGMGTTVRDMRTPSSLMAAM